MYLYDATLAMKVFAKPSAERNSLLILASETGRACIEPDDNDSALLEALDDAKCGGRRGWIGYEERRAGTERERLARSLFSRVSGTLSALLARIAHTYVVLVLSFSLYCRGASCSPDSPR